MASALDRLGHGIRTVLVLLLAGMIFSDRLSASVQAPGETRDQLTAEQLNPAGPLLDGPIHNAYFMPIGPWAPAPHQLLGTLDVPAAQAFNVTGGFPGFSFEVFTHDGHLVPVERDIIKGDGSTWDIILAPGRVWSEPGDEGWSRASFPFTLTGRIWNESHNGLASFLFKEETVSALQIQVVQEAAPWSRFDASARLSMSYRPSPITALDAARADFADELAERLPMRSFSELSTRVSADLLDGFDGPGQHITFSGLVIDGALFAGPCHTRFGDYPYCREMRHGVFSVTKTMGAALSLLRLAQKFGDRVFEERIADYLEVTADHDGWAEVTFGHTLNMMTGVGDTAPHRSTGYQFTAESGRPTFRRFGAAVSGAAKLKVAFSAGNYDWGPGEVGRYDSVQTFVVGAAMDAFLKRKEGADARLWDMVIREVLAPIGVRHAPLMHSREAGGARGLPIMGWGYVPTVEEIAKIAILLQAGGMHEGRQLLSEAKLREVFAPTTEPGYAIPGLPSRYHLSFWFSPFHTAGPCSVWIPEMKGHGGNLVTLMPNGMSGIRLADERKGTPGMYDSTGMAKLANSLEPFCP